MPVPALHAAPPGIMAQRMMTRALPPPQGLLTAKEAERMIEQMAVMGIHDVSAAHVLMPHACSVPADSTAATCRCRQLPMAPLPAHRLQVGSAKFMAQHDWIEKLNLQASHKFPAQPCLVVGAWALGQLMHGALARLASIAQRSATCCRHSLASPAGAPQCSDPL